MMWSISYSSSCYIKPIRLPFIFKSQIIYLIATLAVCRSIKSPRNQNVDSSKKEIMKYIIFDKLYVQCMHSEQRKYKSKIIWLNLGSHDYVYNVFLNNQMFGFVDFRW